MNDLFNQQNSARRRKNPFDIRLDPVPIHEKTAYIHSVCAALIESRFSFGVYELDEPTVSASERTEPSEGPPDNPTAWYAAADRTYARESTIDALNCQFGKTEKAFAAAVSPKRLLSANPRGSPQSKNARAGSTG